MREKRCKNLYYYNTYDFLENRRLGLLPDCSLGVAAIQSSVGRRLPLVFIYSLSKQRLYKLSPIITGINAGVQVYANICVARVSQR
jgi:hypothetical protein